MSTSPTSPVAIVTGAGSGIGRAVCRVLADAGFRLALVGRDERKLLDTVALLSKAEGEQPATGPETLVLPADVSDRQQAESIVDLTVQRWGRVDALINNAAVVAMQPIDQTEEHTLYSVFAINTFGPLYLIARCWPIFSKQQAGRIVNVSSMSAIDPFPGLGVYGASKAALDCVTRAIGNEGKHLGIRGFSVVLGAVETSMLRQVVSERDLPTSKTLNPLEAAAVIAACAMGQRDEEAGQAIMVHSP